MAPHIVFLCRVWFGFKIPFEHISELWFSFYVLLLLSSHFWDCTSWLYMWIFPLSFSALFFFSLWWGVKDNPFLINQIYKFPEMKTHNLKAFRLNLRRFWIILPCIRYLFFWMHCLVVVILWIFICAVLTHCIQKWIMCLGKFKISHIHLNGN